MNAGSQLDPKINSLSLGPNPYIIALSFFTLSIRESLRIPAVSL